MKFSLHRSAIIFCCCMVVGSSLRLWLSSFGYNYDLQSYWIVSDLVLKDRPVYAETSRYNYGPIWYLLLGMFRRITIAAGTDDIFNFHIVTAAFLTLIDAVIALLLRDRYGMAASLFFFLNPVSILITGYHSQFDNFAILVGLIACLHLSASNLVTLRRSIVSASIIGLSIATKHVLLFFPFWIFWLYRETTTAIRLSLIIFSFGVAAIFFAPLITDERNINGIIEHVGHYTPMHENGLMTHVLDLFVNIKLIQTVSDLGICRALFVLLTIISGAFWISLKKRRDEQDLLFLYLLTLLVFTSSMTDQYLAIPIVALAIYRSVWSWIFTLTATTNLLTSWDNVFGEIFSDLQIDLQVIEYHHAQI